MDHRLFFESLPVFRDYRDILKGEAYRPLPDGWSVAMTDVRDSTAALDDGRFKEVNALGGISIMGILNLVHDFRLPFMFGGDGATICIPSSLLSQTRKTLLAVREIARSQFKLDLHAGLIPIEAIRSAGFDVAVARLRVSEYFYQAIFSGGGIAHAERLIKESDKGSEFLLTGSGNVEDADLTGFECRWQNVSSTNGEIVTLIVESIVADGAARFGLYRDVVERIRAVYGQDERWRPIQPEMLAMTMNGRKLSVEQRIRTAGKKWWDRIRYGARLRVLNITGTYLMKRKKVVSGTDWGLYKEDLAANTDFRKFDDTVRLVMSGTPRQRTELQEYLESMYRDRKLVYGLHVSDTAHITCLLFSYMKNHIHFVDGSAGGYSRPRPISNDANRVWNRVMDGNEEKGKSLPSGQPRRMSS